MKPRVTVGISFHDEERLLAGAVRSVLGQTFSDFELLLVNDGSTDRSLEIARSFLHDARVRVYSDGARRHLGARLNDITRRAAGELVARMDADDLMHPDKLALQIEHLDREDACDAVGTWAALVGDDDRVLAIGEARGSHGRQNVLLRPPIPHATMLARKAWLQRYPYDETLARAEDRDLWCRAAKGGSRIEVLADVLYVVRVSAARAEFLPDYLRGHADLRRVLLRHGMTFTTRSNLARLVGASMLKSIAMAVAYRFGAADALVRRRGRPPTEREQRRIEETLRAVRGQPP